MAFNLQFEQDVESGWFVASVLELPGCVSQGETMQAATANIADAIRSYVGVLLEDANKIKKD